MKNYYSKAVLMLLFIMVTAFTLNRYAMLIQSLLRIHYDWKFELCMVLGQLLFQLPFIFKKTLAIKGRYYYNMLLVSFMGAVLLWPLLIINHLRQLSHFVNIGYFFCVVLFMFTEHRRRVKKLELPAFMSYTWVLYRLIILAFII
ncbi:hypothetical protein ACTHGU_12730 [Chitinophagaceae bacterium MMS25-I14]